MLCRSLATRSAKTFVASVRGLDRIPRPGRIEVLPYMVGSNRQTEGVDAGGGGELHGTGLVHATGRRVAAFAGAVLDRRAAAGQLVAALPDSLVARCVERPYGLHLRAG